MVSETKTGTYQLDLLMEALKTSIRKALDDDLLVDESEPNARAFIHERAAVGQKD